MAFEIFAPPLWPISMMGGTPFRATDVSTEVVLIGICLLEDTTLTTPPPTTAPTAKHAAWMKAELGIFHSGCRFFEVDTEVPDASCFEPHAFRYLFGKSLENKQHLSRWHWQNTMVHLAAYIYIFNQDYDIFKFDEAIESREESRDVRERSGQ